MMRVFAAALAAAAVLSGAAEAQTSDDTGYIEGVAQSAFGNVTSQSFGAEAGYNLTPTIQIFVEGGRVRDAAAPEVGQAAQQIAGYLSGAQSAPVAYQVKQPVTFGAAGIRYLFAASPIISPYVLAGGGIAQVKNDVAFTIGGNDVTSSLSNYGVVLGSDLSGSATKALMEAGVGVQWAAWQRLVLDFQYRYSRVFTDPGFNINRAGIGVGVRF